MGNIDQNELRELLARYYDGETTRDEEARIKYLLDNADILPEDLMQERDLFEIMSSPLPEYRRDIPDFRDMIASVINSEAGDDKPASAAGRFALWRRISVAAAVAVVIFSVIILRHNGSEKNVFVAKDYHSYVEPGVKMMSPELNADISVEKESTGAVDIEEKELNGSTKIRHEMIVKQTASLDVLDLLEDVQTTFDRFSLTVDCSMNELMNINADLCSLQIDNNQNN